MLEGYLVWDGVKMWIFRSPINVKLLALFTNKVTECSRGAIHSVQNWFVFRENAELAISRSLKAASFRHHDNNAIFTTSIKMRYKEYYHWEHLVKLNESRMRRGNKYFTGKCKELNSCHTGNADKTLYVGIKLHKSCPILKPFCHGQQISSIGPEYEC